MATGTVTVACIRPIVAGASNSIARYDIVWTSNASGAVNASIGVNGCLLRWTFVPSSTVAPTDAYDLVMNDVAAIDVLQATGANLSATATTEFSKGITFTDGSNNSPVPRAVCDDLNLVISNAGNAKSGTIHLYVR